MVKVLSIPTSYIAKERSCRFDYQFISFQRKYDNKDYYGFNELFEIVTDRFVKDIPEELHYCEIGNVSKSGDLYPVLLKLSERNEFNEDLFKKIERGDILKPDIGNILISSVRPNLTKFVFIKSEDADTYFTKAFFQLKPIKNGLILYYLLRGILLNELISVARKGKGYPTLKKDDLQYLKFDRKLIDSVFSNERELTRNILPIESDINKLKKELEDSDDIINRVFSVEFKCDLGLLHKAKLKTIQNIKFSNYGNNPDLRFSCRFHSYAGKIAYGILMKFDLPPI